MGIEFRRGYLTPDSALYGNTIDGLETVSRDAPVSSGMALSTGLIRFSYFTPPAAFTATNAVTATYTTAAGATPTLCRVGFYTVASNGNLTLVAATANTTSLWATVNTVYETALTATYTFQPGQRYAAGALCVTGATAPQLVGQVYSTAAIPTLAPQLTSALTGQTDLPASITAGSLITSGNRIYIAATA